MFSFKNKIAQILLNVLRAFNIIALLGVIASAVVLLIKTFTINGFFFFDSLTHVINIIFAFFLIVSEVPIADLVRTWYSRNFPLLSLQSGLAPLGLLLVANGSFILGNLNNSVVTGKDFGQPFYSAIVAGGVLPLIAGFLNVVASFIFCDRKLGVTARMIRHFGRDEAKTVASDVNSNKEGDSNSYYEYADVERAPPTASWKTRVASSIYSTPVHPDQAHTR